MPGWWRAELNPQGLSQGDVIRVLISGTAVVPVQALRSRPFKKGIAGWEVLPAWAPGNNDVGHYLASGKMTPCLVVSHSCDLEKPKDTARVLIAPMRPLAPFKEEDREIVLRQENINLFPLPEIPGLEDHCADLRCISYVDRKLVDASELIVSMAEDATKILQARLVHFFTRIKIPKDQFTKST